MGCSNSGNKFEVESLLMPPNQEARKEVINDVSWMKDLNYEGEMKSAARILENSFYYYPKVPEYRRHV